MARHVLLNNIDHAGLRVDRSRSVALGDGVMHAPIIPAEFRNVQSCYPIVFRAAADGAFQPVALFGLREGQNLFLSEGRWDAAYLPLSVERQPFMIGRDGEGLMVHVDLDSPRLSTGQGEPVFREHGGTSEYLDRITSALLALHEGLQATPAFVEALARHRLLESFVLDIDFGDGTQGRLAGFHAIAEERLRALDAEAVAALHRDGHLEPVYMAVASLGHLRTLIDKAGRSHGDGA